MARVDLTEDVMREAIKNSFGIYSIIQKRLRADYQTVKKYIFAYELQDLVNDEKKATTDLAEVGLLSHLKEKNLNAIVFQLNRDARREQIAQMNQDIALAKATIEVADEEARLELEKLMNE